MSKVSFTLTDMQGEGAATEGKKRKLTPSDEEETLKLDILKLKDAHADEIRNLKQIHETDKMDMRDAFTNDLNHAESRYKKQLVSYIHKELPWLPGKNT